MKKIKKFQNDPCYPFLSGALGSYQSNSTDLPHKTLGPGYSKLTTSLVNELLKFQRLISQIYQYFLLKTCEKLLQCKCFSHFFNIKYQCIGL